VLGLLLDECKFPVPKKLGVIKRKSEMNEYYTRLHEQALYAAKIFALVKYLGYDVWYVEFKVTRCDVFTNSRARVFITSLKPGYSCEIVVCNHFFKQYNAFEAYTIAKELNRSLPESDRVPFSDEGVGPS
jgi:hypothetical protein